MTNDEYQSFLKYVFHEYIEKRLPRLRRYFDHPKMCHEWEYEWRRLKRALHLLKYIQDVCDDTDDIYSTFHLDRLRRAIGEVQDGVRWHNRLANEGGFFDAWDSHFEEIIEGVCVELIPEAEFELMKELGFTEPKTDLEGIMYVVKKRAVIKRKNIENLRVSSRVKNVVEDLSHAQKDFQEPKEEEPKQEVPKKERRWFKGIAQIGQGAALSIGDIALAVGTLKFPVSPEAQTWGALVSATTGVGMIFNGIGEWRGE